MQHPYDLIYGDDLDTARRRLRYLAEKACGELDARTLKTVSFHLAANLCQEVKANNGTLDLWAGDDAWTIRKMGEIEAARNGPRLDDPQAQQE
jgi:hypothetical protein